MKKIQKILVAWLLILSMITPSVLTASAAGGDIQTLDNGVISQEFSDITSYRVAGNLTAPSYPNYVFAGWYTDAECKTALSSSVVGDAAAGVTAYAKFVPDGVLSIKAQVTGGTNYASETADFRFVTTVDSTRYQSVGFDVVIGGVNYNCESTTVYYRMYAVGSDSTVMKSYTPDVFDEASKCFMACIVEGVPNRLFGTGIEATPYWVTLDGTKVAGVSATKTVNMSYMPSVATLTTEVVTTDGSIVYPFVEDATDSSQGGCWDGQYYYQAVMKKNTDSYYYYSNYDAETNASAKEVNQNLHEVIIQKYVLSEDGNWALASDLTTYQSEVLKLRHANDITYNPNLKYTKDSETKTGLLVIAHCGNYGESKYYVSFMDKDDLTIVAPADVDIDWEAAGYTASTVENPDVDVAQNAVVTNTYTSEYVVTSSLMTNISYNSLRNQYVVGISGSHKLRILDSKFQPVGEDIEAFSDASNYTAQGIGTDDSYIYFLFSAGSENNYKKNVIAMYDWDGNFINVIELTNIDAACEIENISMYNNTIYIGANNAETTGSVIHKVTGLNTFASDIEKSTDLFTLNQTAATDIYAETVVKVSETKGGVWARTGLRLANTDGDTIDFILNYNNSTDSQTLVNALVAMTPSGGSESQQGYAITSVLGTESTDGIKLSVAKRGEIFYFYVNNVLQGTKTYDAFTADTKVTASLYSKYTTSSFTNYSATMENIHVAVAEMRDTFVADAKKSTIYFDVLNEASGIVKTTETGSWAGSSIVNWNKDAAEDFYVETTVKIDSSNNKDSTTGVESTAYAGLVLTSGTNRYFVMLVGNSSGISSLKYATMQDDNFANKKSEGTLASSSIVTFLTENKLALDKNGNSLTIYLNDSEVTTIDLSGVTYPVTGETTVGLVGWKANATFTDYSYATRLDGTASTDVNVLNGTAATDIYAEAYVKTVKAEDDAYPRAGLRLTNDDGTNVDFVISYTKNATPTYSSVLSVQTNSSNNDVSGTAQTYYGLAEIKNSIMEDGVKLAIAKKGESIYFYVNDVLQAIRTFDGFGESDKVTARLYSKNTVTYFSEYSAMVKNFEPQMSEAADTFIADEIKTGIYFNNLNEEAVEPKITTDENIYNASIVNFNVNTAKKLYAETIVELEGSYWEHSGAGFVLTSGENRFFVLLEGSTAGNFSKLQCYSMTGDDWSTRTSEYSGDVSSTEVYKLAVLRDGNVVYVLINDEVQTVMDLSNITYEVVGATKVGLTGVKAKATFTNYSIKIDSEVPTVDSYNPLLVQGNMSSTKYSWITEIDETNNEINLGVESAGSNETYLTLTEEPLANVYAEATITTPAVGNVNWPFVGLQLLNENNEYINFYLYFNNTSRPATPDYQGIEHDGATGKSSIPNTSFDDSVSATEGIKLAVAKQGETIYIYVNDILKKTITNDSFGVDDKVDVRLYSKNTMSTFMDYSVTEGWVSDITNSKDVMALNTTAATDIYAETVVKIEDTSTSMYPRAGIRLTNASGISADFIMTYNKDETFSGLKSIQTTAKNEETGSTGKNYTLTDAQLEAASTTGIKLAIALSGETLCYFVDDVCVGTRVASDVFGTTDNTVTAYIYSKATTSMFTDFLTTTPDETMLLVANAVAKDDATVSYVVSDGVPEAQVSVKGSSTGNNGYMFFKEKNTKIYAETYIDLTSGVTTSDNRVGLALTNADKNAQLGIYLYAKPNGVTQVNIYAFNALGGATWTAGQTNTIISVNNPKLADIDGLNADLGRDKIKLAVLRDGDNVTVYVNDVKVKTVSIDGISGFNIASTDETYIGLYALQQTGKYYDFTYVYGDDVDSLGLSQ